jgi:transketolase
LIASGSEVGIAWEAAEQLTAEGHSVRVVSFPCWKAFEEQSQDYKNRVLPPHIKKRVVVEAAIPMGWERYAGEESRIIGMTGFGASAPYEVLYEQFSITADNVVAKAKELLK